MTYQPKVYRDNNGDRQVIAAGGELLLNGVVRGPSTAGQLFFVDSVNGSSGNDGLGMSTPKATLTQALALCTASRGDIIYLMPGHTETGTAAAMVDIDKAGVTIVGVGQGSLKATFNFGTATTCDIDIDAANVTIRNVRFVSAIDDLAVMLDVNEGNFVCEDCEFIGPSTLECLNFVNLATTKDDFAFRRCRWLQNADPTGTDGAAATGAIYVVDSENIVVEDCIFDGFFETACLHNKTTALKYLTWRRNAVNQQLTITGRRILLVAGTVGANIGVDNDFIPGLGYRIQKTEDVETATADVLFTVVGKVLIKEWFGEVTNALHTTVTDYLLEITSGADLQAAGDISSAVVGHTIRMNSDAGDTILAATTPAVSVADHADADNDAVGGANRIVGRSSLTSITLQATRTAGAAGDAILHTIYYIPLEPGAFIIAAA